MTISSEFWQRAIIHVDMNSFFAAIEQLDNPEWRGQPIAITNGAQGSCIITSSYEARAYGVKTGMRLKDAYQLCPTLIKVPSRPDKYTEISKKIMSALEAITPDIEVFSVDEAFLDVTRCQKLHGHPEKIGWMTKQVVYEASELRCSVGVSGDKTTAKFASNYQKPNGFTIIPPWEAKERLQDVPVKKLCGIADGIEIFLARHGVYTCGDMERLPIGILAKRFGHIDRRIWLMCQGADPEPVKTRIAAPKSMGHGKVLPPNTRDLHTVLIYLRHMAERLAARLRRHHLEASFYFIGIRSHEGWMGAKQKVNEPTNDGKAIYELGYRIIKTCWTGAIVRQIQVTALDPQPTNLQQDLFSNTYHQDRKKFNDIVDAINERFGEFAIAPAPLLNRSSMHNVISPAWRPDSHRQTI